MKMLISSCIRQKPEILKQFLESLDKLKKPFEHKYFFITNNLEKGSERILSKWAEDKPVEIKEINFEEDYIVDEETHRWSPKLVDNIMKMKRVIIERAGGYDYLFLIDSDMYLHPKTLEQLLSRKKDIISEICWTRWHPNEPEFPNCWFFDKYSFFQDSLNRLRNEELIEVGGFGGMALVSKKALDAGVNYDRIDNLNPEWGEDRHFAIRARVLGFKLFVDTKHPAFHIYRENDLKRIKEWKTNKYRYEHTEYNPVTERDSILIAVPHTGNINAELVGMLMNLFVRNRKYRLGLELNYGMPVDSNRNHIVKEFLNTGYEWLLMIDSDIVPPLNVLDLLKHNKKIVGGVCMTTSDKGIPYPVIMRKDLKKGWGWKVDRRVKPLMKVDATGASCLLIHREVLEKMKSPFRLGYDKDGIVTVVGEDFDFCTKAKKAGYDVWVDTTIQCKHFKNVDLLNINRLLGEEAGRNR